MKVHGMRSSSAACSDRTIGNTCRAVCGTLQQVVDSWQFVPVSERAVYFVVRVLCFVVFCYYNNGHSAHCGFCLFISFWK